MLKVDTTSGFSFKFEQVFRDSTSIELKKNALHGLVKMAIEEESKWAGITLMKM